MLYEFSGMNILRLRYRRKMRIWMKTGVRAKPHDASGVAYQNIEETGKVRVKKKRTIKCPSS